MAGDDELSIDSVAGDSIDDFDLYSRFREHAASNATFETLANVMSMMLVRGDRDGARFRPLATVGGKSTFTTAQATPQDIQRLRAVETTNAAVRARVHGVLWEFTSGKERIEHVLQAVDAYLEDILLR